MKNTKIRKGETLAGRTINHSGQWPTVSKPVFGPLFLGPLLCDFNDFFAPRSPRIISPVARVFHEFSAAASAAAAASASTWATSSTLMHFQLVPLTWKCIHHEWLNDWMNEWGMSQQLWGCHLWKRRWTVNLRDSFRFSFTLSLPIFCWVSGKFRISYLRLYLTILQWYFINYLNHI